MTSFWWTIVLAQASQQSAFIQLMPMVLIFTVFYVIWFLPLRKKQRAFSGRSMTQSVRPRESRWRWSILR